MDTSCLNMNTTNCCYEIYGQNFIKENFLNSRHLDLLLQISKPLVKPCLLQDTPNVINCILPSTLR